MQYHLRANGAEPAASAKFDDRFAAENWAMDWVRQHAKQDSYVLESQDGAFAMQVLKTDAGQWYRMPKTGV